MGLGFGLGTHGRGVDPVAHEEHGMVDAGVVAPGATDHATLVTAEGGVDLVGVRVRVRGRVRGREGAGAPTETESGPCCSQASIWFSSSYTGLPRHVAPDTCATLLAGSAALVLHGERQPRIVGSEWFASG